MNFSIFDQYNIRARLSVYVMVFTPLIVTLWVAFDNLIELGASVIVIVIAAAFSNYFFIIQRKNTDTKPTEDYAAPLLYHENKTFDQKIKDRYYEKLSDIEPLFEPLKSESDNCNFKAACKYAIIWLRNNARNNRLVQEENTLYGFINNALISKNAGIVTTISSIVLQGVWIYVGIIDSEPDNFYIKIIVLATIDLLMLLFWLVGVREKYKEFIAEKYAKALIGTIDTLPNVRNPYK